MYRGYRNRRFPQETTLPLHLGWAVLRFAQRWVTRVRFIDKVEWYSDLVTVRRTFSYVTGNYFVVFRTSLLLHKRWLHAWNFGCRNYLSSKTKMRWSATWLPLSWSAPLFSHMHTDFILRPISWQRRFFYFQQHSWRLGMQNQPIPTHPDVRLEICGSPLCNSEYESFLLCTEVIKFFFSCSTQLSLKNYYEYQNSQTQRHFQIQTHQIQQLFLQMNDKMLANWIDFMLFLVHTKLYFSCEKDIYPAYIS